MWHVHGDRVEEGEGDEHNPLQNHPLLGLLEKLSERGGLDVVGAGCSRLCWVQQAGCLGGQGGVGLACLEAYGGRCWV